MQLTIRNNSASNPLSLDLTNYIDVQQGDGMDPASPNFTDKIISHSLLKEGGVLALEDWKNKELVFPLQLNAASSPALAQLVQQINQITTSAGATASWQDDGMSQPTIFDLISGQFDVQYDYRKAQQHWLTGKLRLFAQPFGHTAGARPYAAASGVGPLLMISPYASSGALAVGASTQAGAAGYGGQQQPSGGIFYPGSTTLQGDAPALLQVSYVGPLPNGASNAGCVPYVAVSLLPDANYRPLVTAQELVKNGFIGSAPTVINQSTAVNGQYLSMPSGYGGVYQFTPQPIASAAIGNTPGWSGSHRLFAIARASQTQRPIWTIQNALVPFSGVATINTGDWGLYDLGTFALRASEPQHLSSFLPAQNVCVNVPDGYNGAIDISALVMLPDNATWFANPLQVTASAGQFIQATLGGAGIPVQTLPFTNTFLLDDTVGDQFLYAGASQTSAPSPSGMISSAVRVTPVTRGLVPRPDPKNGPPIIAILGVAQFWTPGYPFNGVPFATGSWSNQQNLPAYAQVNVLERARYVLP